MSVIKNTLTITLMIVVSVGLVVMLIPWMICDKFIRRLETATPN